MNVLQIFHRDSRQSAVIASLAFATAVCSAMLVMRIVYSHSFAHMGLLWNLFLAWLPMLSSLAAYNVAKTTTRLSWLVIGACVFLWLLFFPNAPYILTDILYLQFRSYTPVWYDLIMLIGFAWTGTFLGLISLYLMQSLVRRAKGRVTGWVFAIGVLALSGFGVYLGRYPRWNSWDIFVSPMSLLVDIWQRVSHPFANLRTYGFSFLFSLVLVSIYLMLVAIIGFRRENYES